LGTNGVSLPSMTQGDIPAMVLSLLSLP